MKTLIIAIQNLTMNDICDCGSSMQSWLINHAQFSVTLNSIEDETICIRHFLKNKIPDFVSAFSPILMCS